MKDRKIATATIRDRVRGIRVKIDGIPHRPDVILLDDSGDFEIRDANDFESLYRYLRNEVAPAGNRNAKSYIELPAVLKIINYRKENMHPNTKIDTTGVDSFSPNAIYGKCKQRIVDFIKANGWVFEWNDEDTHSYSKPNSIVIDITEDEVVLVDDSGDFCHIPYTDENCLYTLIGVLFDNRLLCSNYVNPVSN